MFRKELRNTVHVMKTEGESFLATKLSMKGFYLPAVNCKIFNEVRFGFLFIIPGNKKKSLTKNTQFVYFVFGDSQDNTLVIN